MSYVQVVWLSDDRWPGEWSSTVYEYLKQIFWGKIYSLIHSIYSPFVKLTAHRTTMHHSILYLFYCLSLYLCI